MIRYRVERLDSSKPKGRCRDWRLCIRTRERYANGRWKWSMTRFHGTYSEAENEAQRLALEFDDGVSAPPSSWTFETYTSHWNDVKLSTGQIAESTHDKNSYLLAMLSRHIGRVKITELTPSHVERAYTALRKGDSPSGKELSSTTLLCAHGVGFSAMEHAMKSGLVAKNPFDGCAVPKSDTAERKSLGVADEALLALSLDPRDRHHMALLLMMEAGLRRGECSALRWDDVDGAMISVSRSMRTDGTEGPTKGGKARFVPISSTLADALVARRAAMEADAAQCLTPASDCPHVLSNGFGEPLRPDQIGRWWYRHRAEFGMEGWTVHEFRHTYCSNLAEADVHPKLMQQLMGHSSERTCMQVYTHVHNQQLVDAMAALDSKKRVHG